MRLKADEVEKMAYKLSNIFVNDENRFYDICGKLFIYLKCIGDGVNADLIKREVRRSRNKLPRRFKPIIGIRVDPLSFDDVEDSVLCLCSKIVSGMKVGLLEKVRVLFRIFRAKSEEEFFKGFKWIELVIFKNNEIISLDEILEGRSI